MPAMTRACRRLMQVDGTLEAFFNRYR